MVDLFQNQAVDSALAQVFGDLGAGVIGAKQFLVDVLFKDIAQHRRVDLVIRAAGGVVEVPRVAAKEIEQLVKGRVGDVDVPVLDLDRVGQEQAAVEIADASQQRPRRRAAPVFRPRQALEKEGVQKFFIIAVGAALLALRQPGLQIVKIAVVEKALALQKIDKHQPVEQCRCIPATVALVFNAPDMH